MSAMAPAMFCSQRKTRNEKGRNIVFFLADPGVLLPTNPERGKGRRRLPSDESFMNVGDLGKT